VIGLTLTSLADGAISCRDDVCTELRYKHEFVEVV